MPPHRSLAARYGFAVAVAGLAVAVRLALTPLWGLQLPLITFFPAIMASAWLGGFGPGLTTTLLSALSADYFFMEPLFTLRLSSPADIVAIGMFVGIGVFISLLTEVLYQTQRRQAAALGQALAAERHLGAQHAVTRVLAETASLREATPRLLQAVCESAGWDVGALWTLDEADRVLRCLDAWHVPAVNVGVFEEATRQTAFPPGVGLPGRIWASGTPAWIVDVVADPNFPRAPDAARVGLHGAFGFPIRLGSQTLGVIEFFSRARQQPDEDLLTRMAAVGSQVGQFIERQRAEVAVRASEARKTAIVEAALDCIIAMDHEGRITEFNPAAERTFGYRRADTIGRSLAELIIPPELRERHHRGLARYLQTGEGPVIGKRIEIIAMRADGTVFPAELAISQVTADGRPAFTGHVRDVSERKKAESEREELLAREQAARTEAESANRAKDEFLAVLSHELRTPLNAVYGYARMLQAGQLAHDAAARALDVIVRNANAQVQLIDDLLDVSRVISGKLRLNARSVDLKAVVEAALDTVRPAAEAKGIRLQTVLDPGAGPITGDPDRLQQVVWNLLTNAVKFTPKGGRVQVHLQRINSHIEIVVSDMGEGIAPDMLPFIFDRFRQGDSSSTRPHAGLGLGLALVKHLVELHGGTVAAQSPGTGLGATFIVKLPLSIAQVPPEAVPRVHPTTATIEPSPAGARLDGLRLLVTDDDPDAVDLMSAILTGAGAIVRGCRSASEALGVLQEWRPDVLVSDIEMPGEDGYSLIRKVRALDETQGGKTPAVALTAYGRRQDRVLSLSAGYSMHVPKPVDPGELTTIIASLVARPLEP